MIVNESRMINHYTRNNKYNMHGIDSDWDENKLIGRLQSLDDYTLNTIHKEVCPDSKIRTKDYNREKKINRIVNILKNKS